jgi:hypothetical protein
MGNSESSDFKRMPLHDSPSDGHQRGFDAASTCLLFLVFDQTLHPNAGLQWDSKATVDAACNITPKQILLK